MRNTLVPSASRRARLVMLCAVPLFCHVVSAQVAATPLRMGIYPIYDAKTTIRIFQPLADYLSSELHRPIKLVSAADGRIFLDRALEGSYDLLWPNNAIYLQLHDRGLVTVIARGEPSFRGMAVVLEDSPFHTVADLKGTRITAVSQDSLAGFIFLKLLFSAAGMDITRDATVTFAPKVESIPFLVLSGKADVGVYVEDLYQRSYAYDDAAKRLRVLVYSPPIPQFPFVVRAGLDTASIAVLREALARIDGSSEFGHEFLAELRIDRISRADDASYDEFRAYYQSVKR